MKKTNKFWQQHPQYFGKTSLSFKIQYFKNITDIVASCSSSTYIQLTVTIKSNHPLPQTMALILSSSTMFPNFLLTHSIESLRILAVTLPTHLRLDVRPQL